MGCGKLLQSVLGLALIMSFALGCGAPANTPKATSTPTPVPPTQTLTPSPPEHRIRVRVKDGVGEFYDRVTGEKFIPRGNNYVRLAVQESILYHSTLNVGLYDPASAELALQSMHANGYNLVRVFLTNRDMGDPAGGLSEAYIANLVDFLRKAKSADLFALLTVDSLPNAGGYTKLQNTTWSADFPGIHGTYLTSGGILAERQFWSDLIQALIHQDAPLDAIFAYELRNEQFFLSDAPPLTLTSGIVETANGESYNMASEADRQRMLEQGLVFWIDSTRARILELDPTALVTVGFFVPQAPIPTRVGDSRLVVSAPAIWDSQADFVDLHPYPDAGLTLRQFVVNFGLEGMQERPIIMGEFGAHRTAYSSPGSAASVFMAWQIESCQYGFDGWLFWTWDAREDSIFYNALDGNGEINQAMAPVNRPDPCRAP